MRVFLHSETTGTTLKVVRRASDPLAEIEAPRFIHHSGSWSHFLRHWWCEEHIGPGSYDWPTAVHCAPPVSYGDNDMHCGDLRLYQTR